MWNRAACGKNQIGTATPIINAVKTRRPPSTSAAIPSGRRASAPSRTGTATRSAVCVAERWKIALSCPTSPLTSPQVAKQTKNETVASARCRRQPVDAAATFGG